MKKKTLTEALVLEDFQKAVVFLTLLKIKKNFNNASEYANSKHNDKAKYLHIDSKIIKRFSTFDNKRLFNKFLQKSNNLFDFHKHVALKYASGKKFKINSWFELKFSIDELDEYLKNDLYMSLKSELYSKRVHKILDNLFNSKKKKESNTTKSDKEESNTTKSDKEESNATKSEEKKEESNMTKAEEKAIYDKAANGELGCTPEYVIKQINKKERSQKRRQETIAKKAVQASFEDFAKLKAENEQLKAEIAKLKQLKDLNSDIPNESIENSELEKLKADAAKWRKIDSDPFACEQHYNEVLSRMQPAEDDEEEEIVVDQAMQAQLDQIRQLQSKINYGYNYDKIIDDFCKAASAPDFVRDGSDIPDVPPEPAHAKPPVDDIPTDEEQKEDKAKLLSFKLQEFLDKKYLQLSEAETLKQYSIYSSEIPALEDKKHVNLDDTSSRWQQRATIARYIQKHMHEFNIDNWNENKYPKNWAVKVLKNEDFMKKKARLS